MKHRHDNKEWEILQQGIFHLMQMLFKRKNLEKYRV